MIAYDESTETKLECSHCGVELSELPGAESSIRYFCCPKCTRWQSTMYAPDVLRRNAGVRRARPQPVNEAKFEQIKSRLDAWLARIDAEDPHAVLGVPARSTPDQVRERYRELAMQHHPDRGGDAAQMRRINEAYERIRSLRR